MNDQVKISVQQLIKALMDEEKPIHPRYLYRLSDITPEDSLAMQIAWPGVSAQRRAALIDDLEELGEDNYTLSFENFALMTVNDPEASVREASLRVLWEYETPELLNFFVEKLDHDPDPGVRAAAATGLGRFIFLGEIEELSPKKLHSLEERLLKILRSEEPALVRRRALESMGYSSREEMVPLIESAYYNGDNDWMVSALFAMSRSANKAWERLVFDQLNSDIPQVCAEAARAAGELEIKKSKPRLMRLLRDEDSDVRMAAAWSLSQIGGDGVEEALDALMESAEDDEEAEFLEAALENLAFTEETELFALLELSDDEDEDDDLIELEDVDEILEDDEDA